MDLGKEKQQELQQEIEEGFQEAIGFIHRCALWKFLKGNPTNAPLDGNAQDVKSGKQCEQCSVEIAVAQLVERISRMEQQHSSFIHLRQTSWSHMTIVIVKLGFEKAL